MENLDFVQNCNINIVSNWKNRFDKSFITVPIKNIGNILDTLCDEEGVDAISAIIVKMCENVYDLSYLTPNDIVYNYLINTNNISKIIFDELINIMKDKQDEIVYHVHNKFVKYGIKSEKTKLFEIILECVTDEYNLYGLDYHFKIFGQI